MTAESGTRVLGWVPVIEGPDGEEVPLPWCMGDSPQEAQAHFESLNEHARREEGHGLPPVLRFGRAMLQLLYD